jgi:hypothetical protein
MLDESMNLTADLDFFCATAGGIKKQLADDKTTNKILFTS